MQYILLPVDVVATTKQLELNTSKQMVLTYLRGGGFKVDTKEFHSEINFKYNCSSMHSYLISK